MDLLEPGSPDYGPAPIYGYGKGPLDGDSSSNSSEGGSGPFSGQPAFSQGASAPSYPTGAPRAWSDSSHSAPSRQGYKAKPLHEYLTDHGPQGQASIHTEVLEFVTTTRKFWVHVRYFQSLFYHKNNTRLKGFMLQD